MAFFKRTKGVSAPELEQLLLEAEQRLDAAGREFHKKKALSGNLL